VPKAAAATTPMQAQAPAPAPVPAPTPAVAATETVAEAKPKRKLVQLPPADFVYINRPTDSFIDRWKAIYQVISKEVGPPEAEKEFLMTDIGSHTGYFSLNVAQMFPMSNVVSVEGSVGVGNDNVGRTTADWQKIAETSAIKTHLKWMDTLELENNFLSPEVWRLDRIEQLKKDGYFTEVMLLFSVVHHIDGVCEDQYKALGLTPVQGTLRLMASLFALTNVVIVEMANKPWIAHMHDTYGSQQEILKAGVQETGERWTMQRVYQNEWFGTRDVWVLCRVDRITPGLPVRDRRAMFKTVLTGRASVPGYAGATANGDVRSAQSAARAPEDIMEDVAGDTVNVENLTGSPEELADVIEEATALLLDSRAIKQQSMEFMKSLEAQRSEQGDA
jgi:hypothetical protein